MIQFVVLHSHISLHKSPSPHCSGIPIRRRYHTMPVKICYRIVGELSCCGLVGWNDGTDCVTLHALTGGLSLALYELATG